MIYIEIEDRRIKGIYAGTSMPNDGRNYREVPTWFPGVVGQDIAEFDTDWNLRPLEERLRERLIPDAERYKAVGSELVKKTLPELVRDGVEPAPEGMTLDETSQEPRLRPMTRSELVASGKMSEAEKNKLDLADEEAELLAYLSKTDWYSNRLIESGIEIPQDVRADRQQARDRISAIREELAK